MKPSEKHQIKLNDLKSEKMTLDTKVMELKIKIAQTRARIHVERKIEEKDLSAAELWAHERATELKLKSCNWAGSDIIAAHQAGQKHGEKMERERFGPLITACKNTIKHYESFYKDVVVDLIFTEIIEALKNLESNTEPEPGETVPDRKTTLEGLMAYLESTKGDYLTSTEKVQMGLIVKILEYFGIKTPIKD